MNKNVNSDSQKVLEELESILEEYSKIDQDLRFYIQMRLMHEKLDSILNYVTRTQSSKIYEDNFSVEAKHFISSIRDSLQISVPSPQEVIAASKTGDYVMPST